jgi:hypothetical protein
MCGTSSAMGRFTSFQIFLLPTIMCTLLGVGFLSTSGVAHAAPVEAHHSQQASLNCSGSGFYVEFENANGLDLCFSGGPYTWSGKFHCDVELGRLRWFRA